MSIKKDLQSIPERTSIKKILNGEATPKRMIDRSELYTSQEPFGEKIHLNIQDKLKKANNENVPLISMGETEESVHINSSTKTKLLADQNQADGFPLAYFDTGSLYQDGNQVTLDAIAESSNKKHLSLIMKDNLNDGKSPDGNKYFEDLIEQFGYEQITEQIHAETCPNGDLGIDYSADQRGILVRVKYPILLRDFKFNYDFVATETCVFKIEKYNSGHTALTTIYSFNMSNLVAIGEHSIFPFSNVTAHNGDMEVYLTPGDYYISLIGVSGKIELGAESTSNADKWENNYIVALQGNATGSLPNWSTLWGQDNVNWYYIFDLEFDTLNKDAGLGHFASAIAVDDLLEGAWFTYNKSGVPSRVQLMNGTRHWTDPGGTL